MGRMIDILRTADRRPAAEPTADSHATAEVEIDDVDDDAAVPDTEIESDLGPPIEDDNDVPYIEVGGGRETNLRLVPAPQSPLAIAATEAGSQALETQEVVRPI